MSKRDTKPGNNKRERESPPSTRLHVQKVLLNNHNTPVKQYSNTMGETVTMEMMFAEIRSLNRSVEQWKGQMSTELAVMNNKIDGIITGWQQDKASITAKQNELEARLDRIERGEKKQNIVITGLPSINEPGRVKSAVDDLFAKHLKQSAVITDAFQIKLQSGDTKIIARLANMEEKTKIMKAKKSLPNNVYINDDLIKNDRILRGKARQFAKSVAGPGQVIRVRTGSVWVDSIQYVWDEPAQTFVRKN